MPKPRLSIEWSPQALSHFSSWILYIAIDSKAAAEKERKDLLKAIDRLKVFPRSGRIVPEFGNSDLRGVIHGSIRIH